MAREPFYPALAVNPAKDFCKGSLRQIVQTTQLFFSDTIRKSTLEPINGNLRVDFVFVTGRAVQRRKSELFTPPGYKKTTVRSGLHKALILQDLQCTAYRDRPPSSTKQLTEPVSRRFAPQWIR